MSGQACSFGRLVQKIGATGEIEEYERPQDPKQDQDVHSRTNTQRDEQMNGIDAPREGHQRNDEKFAKSAVYLADAVKERSARKDQWPSHSCGKEKAEPSVKLTDPRKKRQLSGKINAKPPKQTSAEARRGKRFRESIWRARHFISISSGYALSDCEIGASFSADSGCNAPSAAQRLAATNARRSVGAVKGLFVLRSPFVVSTRGAL